MFGTMPLHADLSDEGGMTHEVLVLCDCEDVEQCRTEVYVSDVRIAYARIEELERLLCHCPAHQVQHARSK